MSGALRDNRQPARSALLCLDTGPWSVAAVKMRELVHCLLAEHLGIGSTQLDRPSVRILGAEAIDAS